MKCASNRPPLSRIELVSSISLLLAWGLVWPAQRLPAQELLPDMVPWVREDSSYLVNWQIQGDDLRMQTMFANIGDGLFQIRTDDADEPGEPGAPDTTPVTQRVFVDVDNGPNFNDYPVNSAANFHGEHGHIHFEDFSEFQLLSATIDSAGLVSVGDLVTNTVKTSFLLHDSEPIPDPQYDGYISYPSSNRGLFQNVSAGWGDIYSHGTEGQSVSLAGVPVGPLYWLRQIVDPTNVIREKDDTNNSFEILIDLQQPGTALLHDDGSFVQPGDDFPFTGLPGDYNSDGAVNAADYVVYRNSLGQPATTLPNSLPSGMTPEVDQEDYDFWAAHFGDTASGSISAALPEPAAPTLLAISLALALSLRRSRIGSRLG